MPNTPDRITVDPQGVSMAVDIFDVYDTSITCYTTQDGGTAHTLPVTISSVTDFWLAQPGDFTVSAKVGGREIAGPAGQTQKVQASKSIPVYLRPVIDDVEDLTAQAASSGGSSTPGAVQQFVSSSATITAGTPGASLLVFDSPPDEVDGTDATIDADGNLLINADGIYSVSLDVMATCDADAAGVFTVFITHGGGTTLPLVSYFRQGDASVAFPAVASTTVTDNRTFPPTKMAAGNVLSFNSTAPAAGNVSFWANLIVTRHDAPVDGGGASGGITLSDAVAYVANSGATVADLAGVGNSLVPFLTADTATQPWLAVDGVATNKFSVAAGIYLATLDLQFNWAGADPTGGVVQFGVSSETSQFRPDVYDAIDGDYITELGKWNDITVSGTLIIPAADTLLAPAVIYTGVTNPPDVGYAQLTLVKIA